MGIVYGNYSSLSPLDNTNRQRTFMADQGMVRNEKLDAKGLTTLAFLSYQRIHYTQVPSYKIAQ